MNMTIGQSGDGEEQIAKEEFQRGDLPKTSFEKRAFEFVGTWCRKSREFVSKKIHRWRLLEDLYHNRLDLRSWAARSRDAEAWNDAPRPGDRWQADIVLSPSYIVDTWADKRTNRSSAARNG